VYQVIKNEETLQSWLSKNEDSVINTHLGTKKALLEGVRLFDTYYGTNRDLQADLGGFTILLLGDDFETKKHFKRIMEYFKLKENEYEYEDKYLEPKRSTEVTFRLYLCSSDYSILIVTVKER
jgi:hypothetical protein